MRFILAVVMQRPEPEPAPDPQSHDGPAIRIGFAYEDDAGRITTIDSINMCLDCLCIEGAKLPAPGVKLPIVVNRYSMVSPGAFKKDLSTIAPSPN